MNEIRERMQNVGQAVHDQLPPGYGFLVLCFRFDAPAGEPGEYVSNASREDVTSVMKEFIDRNPMQTPARN